MTLKMKVMKRIKKRRTLRRKSKKIKEILMNIERLCIATKGARVASVSTATMSNYESK
jgi:hypothetical protein